VKILILPKMTYGILFAKKVYKRTNVVKDSMCKSSVSDEDRNILVSNLNLQKYLNISSRVSLVPFFYFLYKRRFFDKPSPYLIREIVLAGCCIIGLSFADYGSNEYMWRSSREIIKKYGAYSEDYYVDGKAYERMQNKFQNMRKEQAEMAEKFKKEEVSKIVSKNDKMYD